jgi:hypothetical protein
MYIEGGSNWGCHWLELSKPGCPAEEHGLGAEGEKHLAVMGRRRTSRIAGRRKVEVGAFSSMPPLTQDSLGKTSAYKGTVA